MTLNIVQFQDCQAITKVYKKGCHASLTKGATVAPLTADLNFMRSMSSTISKQMDSYNENAWAALSNQEDENENENVSLGEAAKDTVESMISKIGNGFVPGGDFGKILDSDCIPCGVRINMMDELNIKAGISDIGKEMLATMSAWITRAFSQIRNIIDMFKNLDQYVDLCEFFNFFKNFMCIPDLFKILAVLMALMMDLSFELNGVIDFALGLILPLFMPFLTNLLDVLMKYIMLIIKPIECIIDSIQNMLSKLDYNVLFQDLERINVGFGPKQGDPSRPQIFGEQVAGAVQDAAGHFGGSVKLPYFGALSVQDPAFSGEDYRPRAVEFNLKEVVESSLKEEERIRKAEAELLKIRKASASVDGADPAAIEKYKEQEKAAIDEYNNSVRDKNMSAIGKANQNIEKFQKTLKGIFLQLVTFMREACLKIDAIFTSLFDEFKKLLGEFAGGSSLYIDFSVKKLAILQLVGFIKAIIDALDSGVDCEDDEIDAFASRIPQDKNYSIWSDGENINIEEDIGGISDAINEIAIVQNKDYDPNATPLENLSSLINYTGDDILDSNISKTAELLAVASKSTIGCQMLTTVADAEKVNQWVEELDSE